MRLYKMTICFCPETLQRDAFASYRGNLPVQLRTKHISPQIHTVMIPHRFIIVKHRFFLYLLHITGYNPQFDGWFFHRLFRVFLFSANLTYAQLRLQFRNY